MTVTITALGTGGAFTETNAHNNYVFSMGGRNVLIDAGTTLRDSLPKAGFTVTDITDIFITHLHSDHVGGLEEFLQKCYWRYDGANLVSYKPDLWIARKLLPELRETLKAGLENENETLESYFHTIHELDEHGSCPMADGYDFKLIPTHELHKPCMKSYGFQLTHRESGENILFTGDIGLIEQSQIVERYLNKGTTHIFQDCQFYLPAHYVHSGLEQIAAYYPSHVHARIYLMHYGDGDHITHASKVALYGMQFLLPQTVLDVL